MISAGGNDHDGHQKQLIDRGATRPTFLLVFLTEMRHALYIRCVLMALSMDHALSYFGFSVEPSLYAKVYGLRHSISLVYYLNVCLILLR